MKSFNFVFLAVFSTWLAACNPDAATGPLGTGREVRGYGVVASDYSVTSISLLNPDGTMLAKDFIDSGSAAAGLVTALSGDVVLPTRSGTPDILTIVDRFRTDVVTRVDPETGEILGQIKTHMPNDRSGESAYSSNPHDYVYFDEGTAWVTRFEPNLNVAEDHPDRGNDLLHLDPTDFERGERISLEALNTQAERENPDTGETQTVAVYARPSSLVRLGDHLVVGLARMSLTFDAVGAGMVALVNPEDKSVEGVRIPGLEDCNHVARVPNDDRRVVVACDGFDSDDPPGMAGLAMVELNDASLTVEHIWRALDHPEAAVANGSVVPLGGTEIVAVASGQLQQTDDDGRVTAPARNDLAYVVDVANGEQTELYEAEQPYVLGHGSFDVERQQLLLPDASVDDEGRPTAGVRRFERTDDGRFEALDVIEAHDVLPVRQVRPL